MEHHEDYQGQTLDGRYLVERLLGEGGMGAVYEGRHLIVGRKVAIKFLHAEFAGREEIVKRFYREAQAAAAIRHKNIIDILDVGLSPRGEPYLVMEYLEGESLASMLGRVGRLDLPTAAAILEPTLLALRAAHEKGIIHRDLKPDNIFLAHNPDEAPTVKLIDFGISKFSGDAGRSRLTQTGSAMGTPAYMSPEQARGDKAIDTRSDIYAMGVILYEVLTGALPFFGEHYNALLINVLTEAPRPPRDAFPEFPAEAEGLVLRALSKEPGDRPQTAMEFLDALKKMSGFSERHEHLTRITSTAAHRSFAAGDLGAEIVASDGKTASDVYARMQRDATPGIWAATRTGRPKRNRTKAAVIAGLAVAAVAGIGVLVVLNARSPEERPPDARTGDPGAAAPASEPKAAGAAQEAAVFITVFGAPPGAKITFDGAPVLENPFKVLQRDASFVLSVEAEGHEPFRALVSTKADKIVDAALRPLAAAEGKAAVKTGAKTKAKKDQGSGSDASSSKINEGKRGVKFGKDFE